VGGDLCGGHTARGQRQHDLVDPVQAALPLAHEYRVERAVPVTGTSVWTGPISVSTILARVPLREFPRLRPIRPG
jgi:hypothetical protein